MICGEDYEALHRANVMKTRLSLKLKRQIKGDIDPNRRLILISMVALIIFGGCSRTRPLPPVQRPHAEFIDHPLIQLAKEINPKREYAVFDYPGFKESPAVYLKPDAGAPRDATDRLIDSMLAEEGLTREDVPYIEAFYKHLKDRNIDIPPTQPGLIGGAMKSRTLYTHISRNIDGKLVSIIVIGGYDPDPVRFSADFLGFNPDTIKNVNFRMPVSVEEVQGWARMHELGHAVGPFLAYTGDEKVGNDFLMKYGPPEGFADIFASLFTLRDTGNVDMVKFGQTIRLVRAFNEANRWVRGKGGIKVHDTIGYVCRDGIAEVLRRAGELEGKSSKDLFSMATEIARKHCYNEAEFREMSNDLATARAKLGAPAYYGNSKDISLGSISEKFPEEQLFFKAVELNYLDKKKPWVQEMIKAHESVLGSKP